MKGFPLTGEVREERGSRAARRLRRAGYVPAVVYGDGKEALPIKVSKHELSHIMHSRAGEHALVELKIKGEGKRAKKYLTIIKDVQHDPVTDTIIHADFEKVSLKKPVSFKLPIEFVGVAVGVKKGGVLTPHLHELEVLAKPADAPEVIRVDVSNIELGESLYVKDIVIENVKIISDPEEVVVTVVKPRGVVEEAPAEVAEKEEAEEKAEEKEKEKEEKEESSEKSS